MDIQNQIVCAPHFISVYELSDKYFEMSYPMDISITDIIKMFMHGISLGKFQNVDLIPKERKTIGVV